MSLKIKKIYAAYFSPTGGVKRYVDIVSGQFTDKLGLPVEFIDFTRLENREKSYEFCEDELLIIASPVYAGRVPNKIAPDIERCFHGKGAAVVSLVCYGNRDPGDAPAELQQIMERKGFVPMGRAALVSRHAFARELGAERPDEADVKELAVWCSKLLENLEASKPVSSVLEKELLPYYTPLTESGAPAKFLKAKPVTNAELCNSCGVCAALCPMKSISAEDVSQVDGVCIKCQACISHCPRQAKYFDDEQFISHRRMLAENFKARAKNIFIFC